MHCLLHSPNKYSTPICPFTQCLTPSAACYMYRNVPSKHETFLKHLYNVGPTSKTLGRRCANVIQMFCVCWVVPQPLAMLIKLGCCRQCRDMAGACQQIDCQLIDKASTCSEIDFRRLTGGRLLFCTLDVT